MPRRSRRCSPMAPGAVALMVFPELCLSAYAIDDLLFQDAMLDAVERQVDRLVAASRERFPMFAVGAPLRRRTSL